MNYFERSAHDEAGRRINPHLPGDGTMPSNLATAWSWFVEGALWAHNPECDEWKARALNAIAYLEKLPPILERIKAMRLPEQPPDRDHDDEWHAYVHANAVNHTIDAVLALFDVSRQEPVGSFSDLPAANLAGPEGDARPACEHGYHAPHRYSRTFDGMIERVWCHGPQS